jgi:1-acyl-sn-glycerol-3-phosphate acyltransferase
MSESTTGAYRAIRGFLRVLLRLFFKQVVVEGTENLPLDRGGLLIAGHPNGLIDPALIIAHFPGKIIFGARHGLFSWPLIGPLIRHLGTVPIYRASDESDLSRVEKMRANEESLDSMAQEIANGSYSALFPEGVSHDMSHLSDIKTGASRLYYRARTLTDDVVSRPVIVPVGLYYNRKNIFRSRVLITFHPALPLPESLDIDPGEERSVLRPAVAGLTELIDARLAEVVGATEDWHIHHLMHRARRLIRADLAWQNGTDYRDPGLAESHLGFDRIWLGYKARMESDPKKITDLVKRLNRYNRYMGALGIDDHELSAKPGMGSPLLPLLFLGQAIAVYLLFPPILLLGTLINIGPYWLLNWITRKVADARKDEATVKLFAGAILYPATWIAVAIMAWIGHEELRSVFPGMPDLAVSVVIVSIAIGAFGGYLALVYSEMSAETYRAIRVRVMRHRRKAIIQRLLEDRSGLCSELIALGEGLDLPGRRMPDGSILADSA